MIGSTSAGEPGSAASASGKVSPSGGSGYQAAVDGHKGTGKYNDAVPDFDKARTLCAVERPDVLRGIPGKPLTPGVPLLPGAGAGAGAIGTGNQEQVPPGSIVFSDVCGEFAA